MAAPFAPPLTSLRGTTVRRHRGPLLGRGILPGSYEPPGSVWRFARLAGQPHPDQLIQDTDNDASISRLNAATLNYVDDNFAAEFVLDPLPPRRLPIINRGTYVRTLAIDQLVERFIVSNVGSLVQIVSLGAGTDTRYWRLREKNLHVNVLYHEIDFPSVSAAKLAAIRRSVVLSPAGTSFNVLNRTDPDLDAERVMWGFFRDQTHTQGYLFHPIDLRRPFHVHNLLTNIPTLLISECCLCYLGTEEAKAVLKFFTDYVPTIGIAIYEPTNPTSTFGQTMTGNLAARGLYMPTVHSYPTLDSQMERLRDAGFTDAQSGADVLWLWNHWIPDAEKQRVSSLEMLDELEEWELLASHYQIVWAWREPDGTEGTFVEWVTDCEGQIPYPEEQYWGIGGSDEAEEDGADVKVESIEGNE